MPDKFATVIISLFLVFSFYAFAYEEDEFYCKTETNYKICRRCPTLNASCEKTGPGLKDSQQLKSLHLE